MEKRWQSVEVSTRVVNADHTVGHLSFKWLASALQERFFVMSESSANLWYDGWMEPNVKLPHISLHSRVLVELVVTSAVVEQREFTIVTAKQADFKSGLLDENTPLGHALQGHFAGETIPYRAGDLIEVRILAVAPGEGTSSEAAEERRAAVQKAEAQSEITNQMIFSTASGSKWGDYDVDMDKLLKDDK